jgi:hypothetical protein
LTDLGQTGHQRGDQPVDRAVASSERSTAGTAIRAQDDELTGA